MLIDAIIWRIVMSVVHLENSGYHASVVWHVTVVQLPHSSHLLTRHYESLREEGQSKPLLVLSHPSLRHRDVKEVLLSQHLEELRRELDRHERFETFDDLALALDLQLLKVPMCYELLLLEIARLHLQDG